MRPDPPGSASADAPEDEKLIVDGLERAVAQARRKIPDHDNAAEVVFPSPSQPSESSDQDVAAPVPFDSSAVMEVLRGAINRYEVMGVLGEVVHRHSKRDEREQGAWAEELARANDNRPHDNLPDDNGPVAGESRSVAAGYAPDRRRLAAFVVVLFLLAGAFGYSRFGTDSADKVNTNTVPTQGGQAVTIVTRPSTSAAPLPPPTAASSTVPPSTSTTAPKRGTTVPPSTAPATTEPPTTDTTTSTTDTTTSTTASTTSTTVPTTSTTAPTTTTIAVN